MATEANGEFVPQAGYLPADRSVNTAAAERQFRTDVVNQFNRPGMKVLASNEFSNVNNFAELKAKIGGAPRWTIRNSSGDFRAGSISIANNYTWFRFDTSSANKLLTLPDTLSDTDEFVVKVEKATSDTNYVLIEPPVGKRIDDETTLTLNHTNKVATLVRDIATGNYNVEYSGEAEQDTLFTTHDNTETTMALDDLVPFRDVSDNPDQGQTITVENAGKVLNARTELRKGLSSNVGNSALTSKINHSFQLIGATSSDPLPQNVQVYLAPRRSIYGWRTHDRVAFGGRAQNFDFIAPLVSVSSQYIYVLVFGQWVVHRKDSPTNTAILNDNDFDMIISYDTITPNVSES